MNARRLGNVPTPVASSTDLGALYSNFDAAWSREGLLPGDPVRAEALAATYTDPDKAARIYAALQRSYLNDLYGK